MGTEISGLTIRVLSPALLDQYFAFFDSVALANDRWTGCYCYWYHSPATSAQEWTAGLGAGNRAAVAELVRTGVHQGLLAFADGQPVGWCLAGPRHLIRNVGRMLGSLYYEAGNIGSICCFVVAEPYRRQGVATQLLKAACDHFARMGLAYAEAYPAKGGPSERHYHGPLTMFMDAGFQRVADLEHFTVMRKLLL